MYCGLLRLCLYGTLGNVERGDMLESIRNFPVSLVGLGYMVIGIMNANNGKAKELPFIGKFRIIR